MTFVDDDDEMLFKPVTSKLNSLQGVGILGKHASINMAVYVSENEAVNIATSLLKLAHTVSKSKANQFINRCKYNATKKNNAKQREHQCNTMQTQ